MRNLPFLVAAVVLSCAALAVGMFSLLRPQETQASSPPGTPGAHGAPAAESAELASSLAALEQSVAELRAQVAEIARSGARRPVGVDEDTVRAAVAAWLEAHAGELASVPDAASPEAAPAAAEAVAHLLERMGEPGLSDADRHTLWKEARQKGLLYEVLSAYQTRAEQNPGDAQAQADLGGAYLSATQHEDNPMKQGDLAQRADKSFDKALAIDERHWDARFLKGLSLSFWPSFLGKKTESIRQFEILVEQQETSERDAKHAQSYLYLGNMYEESGQPEKAKAMWARGLHNFPDDAGLRAKVR